MSELGSVEAIATAINRRSWDETAERILGLWGKVRAPELAELLATLELLVVPPGATIERFNLAELRSADRWGRGRLLEALRHRPEVLEGYSSDAFGILEALCDTLLQLEPDPRVSDALLDLTVEIPVVFEQEYDHGTLYDTCLDERDPFTARVCEVCLFHFCRDMVRDSLFSERVPLPDIPAELSEPERMVLLSALLELRALLFDDDEHQAMCANIVADPRDESALRAYAQWLCQQGDQRGDVMLATLTNPSGLVRRGFYELSAHWFGPMKRWAHCDLDRGWAKSVRFRDQPPVGVDWRRLEVGWRPGWARVESLVNPPLGLLTHAHWRALRHLACQERIFDESLAQGVEFPNLTHLSLVLESGSASVATLRERLGHPSLPRLESLRLPKRIPVRTLEPWLRDPGSVRELFVASVDSPDGFWAQAAKWLRRLRGRAVPLRRVVLTSHAGECWIFEHYGRGIDWQAARLEFWGKFHPFVANRVKLVEELGVAKLSVVTEEPLLDNSRNVLRQLCPSCEIEVDPTLPNFNAWPGGHWGWQ